MCGWPAVGDVEVLQDSGDRSPLIIKDIDIFAQPPTNTRSTTLNYEEPHNFSSKVPNELSNQSCRCVGSDQSEVDLLGQLKGAEYLFQK